MNQCYKFNEQNEVLQPLTNEEILAYVPQKNPFYFIDHIDYVNDEEICGNYTFQKSAFFYVGHFPGKPITPGVILLESMCQIGVVAFGIYLLSKSIPRDKISNWLTMFSDAQVEFIKSVYPEERVTVIARKKFWKKRKLSSNISMYNQNKELVAEAVASGIGVAI